jgi:hypothetical protein
MKVIHLAAGALMLGALALSGCGRKDHQDDAIDNVTNEVGNSVNMSGFDADNITTPESVPAPVENVTRAAPPPPTPSQDQQILEDAEASGMTARLPVVPGAGVPAMKNVTQAMSNISPAANAATAHDHPTVE